MANTSNQTNNVSRLKAIQDSDIDEIEKMLIKPVNLSP